MKKIVALITSVLILVAIAASFAGCVRYIFLDDSYDVPDLMETASIEESSGNAEKLSKWGDWKPEEKTGAYMIARWQTPQTFNTVVIEENGSKVMRFNMQYLDENGQWQEFYRSDKIEKHRLCAFDEVTTTAVKFNITDAKEAPSIKNMEIYNAPPKELENDFRVVAYYRFDGDKPSEIMKGSEEEIKTYAKYFEVITHVIIFGCTAWDTEGNILYDVGNGSAIENEEDFAKELAAFRQILDYRENKTDIKITTTVHNPADYASATADSLVNHGEKIVNNIFDMIQKFDLDGIDIDWEYPANKKEWNVYDDFINDMIDKLETDKTKDLTFSSALSHWGINLDKKTIKRIDYLNYMGYDAFDDDGYQSAFKSTCIDGLAYLNGMGFDMSQVNLGIPYYGRTYEGDWFWANWRDYEVNWFDNVVPDIEYEIDGVKKVNDCYFNSPQMCYDKTAYAINTGVGGVMVFRLACDKLPDDPNCLTMAIGKAVNDRIAH